MRRRRGGKAKRGHHTLSTLHRKRRKGDGHSAQERAFAYPTSRDRTEMRHRIAGCFIALVMLASPALAETLQVVGAGSLTDAFTDLIRRFPAGADTIATPEFGPSGLMREKIELGMNADLFASADMEQARRRAAGRPERSVIHFTRNRLCVIARSAVGLTPANMLDRLLDPSVRLATSTQGRTPAETMPGQYSPVPSPSE